MTTHQFSVEMTCDGCSNAITRILTKQLKDGETFNVDLPNKRVTITTETRSKDELEKMLKKSGKQVSYIGD